MTLFEGSKPTKLKSGDRVVFHVRTHSFTFVRKGRPLPSAEGKLLRDNNNNYMFLPGIFNPEQAEFVVLLICEALGLTYEGLTKEGELNVKTFLLK